MLCFDIKQLIKNDTLILDTRPATIFVDGFIPGSIFIGLEGQFDDWSKNLIPSDKPIAIIAEHGKEEETISRLFKIGFTLIKGYLNGGFEAWKKAGERTDLIINVEADELAMDIPFDPNLQIVDVRKENEFDEGHIVDALNIPLQDLTDVVNIANFEETQNLYLHCAAGYRSVIACSLFKKEGMHNIRNVAGGWKKIKEEARIKTNSSQKNKELKN